MKDNQSLISYENNFTLADIFEDSKDCEPLVIGYYDILENDDKDLLFVIPYSGSGCDKAPEDAKLFYDGGKHSVLKDKSLPLLICDNLHPAVRENLSQQKEILACFCPKDTTNPDLKSDITVEFMAKVVYSPNVPLSEKLDFYVEQDD